MKILKTMLILSLFAPLGAPSIAKAEEGSSYPASADDGNRCGEGATEMRIKFAAFRCDLSFATCIELDVGGAREVFGCAGVHGIPNKVQQRIILAKQGRANVSVCVKPWGPFCHKAYAGKYFIW